MLIATLFQAIPYIAKSIFVVCIWLVLLGFLWSLLGTLLQDWVNVQRLHQIPCSGCTFLTGEYNLKCTLHPYKALTEDAIDCLDYEPALLRSSD
jgi:hypothetical protein